MYFIIKKIINYISFCNKKNDLIKFIQTIINNLGGLGTQNKRGPSRHLPTKQPLNPPLGIVYF